MTSGKKCQTMRIFLMYQSLIDIKCLGNNKVLTKLGGEGYSGKNDNKRIHGILGYIHKRLFLTSLCTIRQKESLATLIHTHTPHIHTHTHTHIDTHFLSFSLSRLLLSIVISNHSLQLATTRCN